MNSKKRRERKQLITLGIVAAVILLLVVVYFVIIDVTSGDGDETEPPLSDLGDIGAFQIIDEDFTKITSIKYTHNGETVSLAIKDGSWTVDGDPDFPLDSEKVIEMSEALSDYGGRGRYIYDESRASSYGTDDPLYDITTVYCDDNTGVTTHTRHFLIGNKNSATGNYYFYEPGSEYIYSVTDAIFQYIDYTLGDLLAPVEVPTPELEDVLSLKVTRGSDALFSYDASADTDVDLDADDSPVKRIMNAIPKKAYLSYEELIAYGVDADGEKRPEDYGLGEDAVRVELKYTEYTSVSSSDGGSSGQISREREFVILFGDTFTEGEGDDAVSYVYVTVEGSGVVYRATADDINEINDAVGGE